MTRENIIEYAEALHYRVRIINSYRRIYKHLCDKKEQYNDVLNFAPTYFKLTTRALVHDLMVEMCKLFENDKQVMSIIKLYNICEQNQSIFPVTRSFERDGKKEEYAFSIHEVLLITKENLEHFNKAILNLKNQRDLIWAHSDKNHIISPNIVEKGTPVSWGEIEDLLQFASDFLNQLLLGLTNNIALPYFANDTDIELLFEIAQQGLAQEDKTYGQA